MLVKQNENVVAMFDVEINENCAIATEEINEALEDLRAIKRQIKLLEASQEALAIKIKQFMDSKEDLIDGSGTIAATYKTYEGAEKLHMETLKCVFPEIYKECLAKSDSFRRFLLK